MRAVRGWTSDSTPPTHSAESMNPSVGCWIILLKFFAKIYSERKLFGSFEVEKMSRLKVQDDQKGGPWL